MIPILILLFGCAGLGAWFLVLARGHSVPWAGYAMAGLLLALCWAVPLALFL